MKEQHIQLVKDSFAKVAPIQAQAAALFYQRLFEIAPEARPLFKADMESQGKKLMNMLATAVENLSNLDSLLPAVSDMARRHVDYGVLPEHYPLVGEALIWALQQGLGDELTTKDEEAWAEVYLLLATHMIDAAKAK